jgi:predicted Holliday junction resolvase-like endonuclease
MEITALTIIFLVIFLIGILIAFFLGNKIGKFNRDKYWNEQIPLQRKEAIARSRSVLGGQFSEQLAPYLPGFPFNPNEVRFIGKPVDFIVFKGMDNKDINEVVFVEVKSGDSKLSYQEKKLKDAIENKKVSWHEYRISKELTDKNNFE